MSIAPLLVALCDPSGELVKRLRRDWAAADQTKDHHGQREDNQRDQPAPLVCSSSAAPTVADCGAATPVFAIHIQIPLAWHRRLPIARDQP
jgi:hypothetical protein